MLVNTIEIFIPKSDNRALATFEMISEVVKRQCPPNSIPLRFAVISSNDKGYQCELETLQEVTDTDLLSIPSLFDYRQRQNQRTNAFNAIMLVPTGIDCVIGGHAGDATPMARLLAEVCDHLIIHPNVVNASDINEQTSNCLYVEGSLICRLLMGTIGLQKVRQNRLLMITEDLDKDEFILNGVINCVSGARATLGIHCEEIAVLKKGLSMKMQTSSSGRITGQLKHLDLLFEVLREYQGSYDAVALATRIMAWNEEDLSSVENYFKNDEAPNPWGGIEAALTHMVSTVFNVPSAHAPMLEAKELLLQDLGVVEPRKAAESISRTFLFCVLKGLNQAPIIQKAPDQPYDPSAIQVEDISCLIIPDGTVGLPTLAAMIQGIPVIAIRQNTNMMANDLNQLPFQPGKLFIVDNYLEAIGVMIAIKAGISMDSLQRPIARTKTKYFG